MADPSSSVSTPSQAHGASFREWLSGVSVWVYPFSCHPSLLFHSCWVQLPQNSHIGCSAFDYMHFHFSFSFKCFKPGPHPLAEFQEPKLGGTYQMEWPWFWWAEGYWVLPSGALTASRLPFCWNRRKANRMKKGFQPTLCKEWQLLSVYDFVMCLLND